MGKSKLTAADGVSMVLDARTIGLGGARRVVRGALKKATDLGIAIAVGVVDAGGNPVAFERMDGALLVSGPLALDKAWTAVACKTPTASWSLVTQPGGEEWGFNTALSGRIVVQPGGVPLEWNGEIVGGVGVSGGTVAEDEQCATSAAEVFGRTSQGAQG